jgi:hypothetical protein
MAADERDDREGPGQEGFLTDILREATITGTGDDPAPPPPEPQAAGMPRRGNVDDAADDVADDDGDADVLGAGDADDNRNTEADARRD